MMSFVNVICFQKKLSFTLWSLFSVRLFDVFFLTILSPERFGKRFATARLTDKSEIMSVCLSVGLFVYIQLEPPGTFTPLSRKWKCKWQSSLWVHEILNCQPWRYRHLQGSTSQDRALEKRKKLQPLMENTESEDGYKTEGRTIRCSVEKVSQFKPTLSGHPRLVEGLVWFASLAVHCGLTPKRRLVQ